MTIQNAKSRQPVGAGLILTRLDGDDPRFLLLRGRGTDIWSFSKGHTELCDRGAALRTAVRETYEETGFVNQRDYLIIGSSIRFGKRPYWCAIVNPIVADHVALAVREHSEARWMTYMEIDALTQINGDVRAWLGRTGTKSTFSQMLTLVSTMKPTHWSVPVCSAS